MWTPPWFVGLAISSNAFAEGQGAQGTGWHEFVGQIQTSSRIGVLCMSTIEHREPYDSRGSRTVLGARGGAIPPRDSPVSSGAIPKAVLGSKLADCHDELLLRS